MRKFAMITSGVCVAFIAVAFMVMLGDGVRKIVSSETIDNEWVGQIFMAVFGICFSVFMAFIARHASKE